MDLDQIKQFIEKNKKGLIVGVIVGFVAARILS